MTTSTSTELQQIPRYPDLPEDDWAHAFLHHLSTPNPDNPGQLGNITKAARHAGVSRALIDKRRKNDLTFAAYINTINDEITDHVEAAYIRLITQGASRGVYQKGRLMETITEWDPKAMQWWLERMRPDTYHLATRIEHINATSQGRDGGFTFKMGETEIEDAEYTAIPELDPETSDETTE